jgi:hypothetical protein
VISIIKDVVANFSKVFNTLLKGNRFPFFLNLTRFFDNIFQITRGLNWKVANDFTRCWIYTWCLISPHLLNWILELLHSGNYFYHKGTKNAQSHKVFIFLCDL